MKGTVRVKCVECGKVSEAPLEPIEPMCPFCYGAVYVVGARTEP